MMQTKQTGS